MTKAKPKPRTLTGHRRARRHHEWTRAKMRAFLEALAGSASVTDAAKSVGMSRQSAYDLRARLVGRPFDLAWEVALEHGLQQLAHGALERALNGVVRPHYYHGEKVGEHRVYNEALTMFLLKNPGRIGRHHLARDYFSREWGNLLERVEQGELEWLGPDEPEETAEEHAKNEEIIRDFATNHTHYFRDDDASAPKNKRG